MIVIIIIIIIIINVECDFSMAGALYIIISSRFNCIQKVEFCLFVCFLLVFFESETERKLLNQLVSNLLPKITTLTRAYTPILCTY